MMKVVVKLDINNEKTKQKALKAVSSLLGIASISMDMKEKKLTVIGNVDPVDVIAKVRKIWPFAHFLSVGPEKEEKKKEEPKKGETKPNNYVQNYEQIADQFMAYKALNCHPTTYYYHHCQEENPNACVIC